MCCWKMSVIIISKCTTNDKRDRLGGSMYAISIMRNACLAYGTGETQHAVTQMIKRMFMNVKRFFVTLYGKTELMMTLKT